MSSLRATLSWVTTESCGVIAIFSPPENRQKSLHRFPLVRQIVAYVMGPFYEKFRTLGVSLFPPFFLPLAPRARGSFFFFSASVRTHSFLYSLPPA